MGIRELPRVDIEFAHCVSIKLLLHHRGLATYFPEKAPVAEIDCILRSGVSGSTAPKKACSIRKEPGMRDKEGDARFLSIRAPVLCLSSVGLRNLKIPPARGGDFNRRRGEPNLLGALQPKDSTRKPKAPAQSGGAEIPCRSNHWKIYTTLECEVFHPRSK